MLKDQFKVSDHVDTKRIFAVSTVTNVAINADAEFLFEVALDSVFVVLVLLPCRIYFHEQIEVAIFIGDVFGIGAIVEKGSDPVSGL